MLKGDLSSFSLGEIFQSLAINNHTGTLRISSPTEKEKLIFFSEGEISLFSHGSATGLRIGEVLVRTGAVTFEDLDQALLEQQQSKKLLGEILVEKGLVSEGDIRKALCTKIQEEIYDLFLWKQGVFEFDMGKCPREQFDELQRSLTVSISTNGVIMEGLRRLDEWGEIQKKLPTFEEIFIPAEQNPDALDDIERAACELLDGLHNVEELFPVFYGTRFEFCQLLCRLWESGYIRLLSLEECLEKAAHALSKKKHAEAITALKFATQVSPEDPSLFTRLAQAFEANYQPDEAREAYRSAVRLYADQNELENVASAAESLIPGSDLEARELEVIFHAFIKTGNTKKAFAAGTQLVTTLQKNESFEKATQVLKQLAHVDPRDLNVKLQTATLLDQTGRREEATHYLEEVAEALQGQKKYRDQAKVLRLLLTFDPDRPQLKEKIAALQTRIDTMDKRRKRRVGLAGAAVIGVLLLSVLPMLYEIKARELFKYAERIEQVALLSNDFERARAGYVELVERYSFSTRIAAAQSALDRIRGLELEHEKAQSSTEHAAQEAYETEVVQTRRLFGELLERARLKEQERDFQGAHAIYLRIFGEFSELAMSQQILLPVKIDSSPRGAKILLNDVVVGSTPYVHRYEPGTTVELALSRQGCEPVSEKLTLLDQWEITRSLKRMPVRTFDLPEAVEQPLATTEGVVILLSRDGHIYAVDPKKGIIAWQRTVGRFGDRVSDLGQSGNQIYLCTVTGEVTAMSAANGKSLWIGRVDGPVLAAPTASSDRTMVALATLGGNVYVLDNRDGRRLAAFRTENEIVTSPQFVGKLVVVGSTDNHVYGYSPEERVITMALELSSDVIYLRSTGKGRVVALTSDSRVTLLSVPRGDELWSVSLPNPPSARPVIGDEQLYVADARGGLIMLDLADGKTLWSVPTASGTPRGLSLAEGRIFMSFENGILGAVDLGTRQVLWQFRTKSPVLAPPVVEGGFLFTISTSGQAWLFEVLR